MGRRSVNTTKSGKFMNPTDQARKEARKKELKKNKKQRLLVRTAVLKNKDPGQIIAELDKLDEIEYNPTQAPALAEKVLKDKRKKLKETLDRVMKLYQKEDPSYWSELKRVESDYERRRFHRIQYFDSVKQAENTSVDDIPLPEMIPGGGPVPSGSGSSASVADIPLPGEEDGLPEIHGILKKSSAALAIALPPPTPTFCGREPPGVPVGAPPDLSEMDEYSDEEMEVDRPKSVRFQGEDSSVRESGEKTLSEMDRFMREIEEESKKFMEEEDLQPPGTEEESGGAKPKPAAASSEIVPSAAASILPSIVEPLEPPPSKPDPPVSILSNPMKPAPPPATVPPPASAAVPQFFPPPPPALALGGRMRFPPPPPLPLMRPGFNSMRPPAFGHGGPPGPGPRFRQAPRASVFSSAPQIMKSDTKIVSETMIQAKPQIRSLSADVTRFVPSIIKQKKDDVDKPKRHEYQIGHSQAVARSLIHQQRPPQQSKDDAYAEFMKEMSGLM
ncbi:unnamed protein product [Orchesella dallaii]|uniref:Wbp11/ELF5/Saf1 N-terminal domain-containing protein n=1 Tax=Orchesella dallaii TaxID=48710 RepID=A0ABP1QFF1_9HEXA